jgi:hypothetical protein
VTAPIGQPGEPDDSASAEPDDNDWFRPQGDPPR